MEKLEQKPHNPYCKLIETTIFDGVRFIELVYGINNDNKTSEGLELYFKKTKDGHFYKSRRYLTDEIPTKYKKYFESLQSRLPLMKEGHKAIITLINE